MGEPPIFLKARTGELTPPGIRFCASLNNSFDVLISFNVFSQEKYPIFKIYIQIRKQ
jgi:hypothetical protein